MLGIIDRYANADMIGKRAKVVEIGLAIRQDGKNVSLQKPLKPAWLAELVFSAWGNLLLRCFLPGGMLRNSSLPALVPELGRRTCGPGKLAGMRGLAFLA